MFFLFSTWVDGCLLWSCFILSNISWWTITPKNQEHSCCSFLNFNNLLSGAFINDYTCCGSFKLRRHAISLILFFGSSARWSNLNVRGEYFNFGNYNQSALFFSFWNSLLAYQCIVEQNVASRWCDTNFSLSFFFFLAFSVALLFFFDIFIHK